MPKVLVSLFVPMLLLGFVCVPITTLILSKPASGTADGGSAEIQIGEQALMLTLSSARHPFSNVKSRVDNALGTFTAYARGWHPQSQRAHTVEVLTAPQIDESLSFVFFTKNRGGESGRIADIERRALRLLQKFPNEPEHGDRYAEAINDAFDELSFAQEPGRTILMGLLARVRVSPAKAINILENGNGKGAVVKLPLRLEELKAILNSPAERTFALFRRNSTNFLLLYPGTAGERKFGPMLSHPMSSGADFFYYADGTGHSHPRFMLAQPSKGDHVRHVGTDTFILALVDSETIEVTLWRANESDYRTERGPEALKFLVYLGLVAPEKPTTLSSLPRLTCIGLLFALGTLPADSNHLMRSIGLTVHRSGEGFCNARPHPQLLSSAA
jgi:hypothetical protein